MPFHLTQDMSSLLYEQVYMRDEVVYEVNDPKVNHLYFVYEGLLKVEAQVGIEQEVIFPISQT